MGRDHTRGASAGLIALLAALLAAHPAAAAQWAPIQAITTTTDANMWPGGIATSGTNVYLAYRQLTPTGRAVMFQASLDEGVTWSQPAVISRPDAITSLTATLAASGTVVHASWVDYDPALNVQSLWYRRSLDAGATWEEPVAIPTSTTHAVGLPQLLVVGDTVLLAFTDGTNGRILVARSLDGGATFARAFALGTTTNAPWTGDTSFDGAISMAAGTGVIYLAWSSSTSAVSVRRSFDGGSHWTRATVLENTIGYAWPRVAAAGRAAIVESRHYDGKPMRAVVRLTTNRGSTWLPNATVSAGARPAWEAWIEYAAGRWRLLYAQCIVTDCAQGAKGGWALWYRESPNGKTWSAPTRVTTPDRPVPDIGGMGYTSSGVTWIAWAGFAKRDAPDADILLRSVR